MIRTNRGFTLIELLIVVAIIGILAAIAIPGLMRARIAANESSAIGSLRSIHSAQHAFWSTCGRGFYSATLIDLGRGSPGGEPFLPRDLGIAQPARKSGYLVWMSSTVLGVGVGCSGGPISFTYQATADPVTIGTTGDRFFGTNAGGAIYQSTASLTGAMPEVGPAPAPAIPMH